MSITKLVFSEPHKDIDSLVMPHLSDNSLLNLSRINRAWNKTLSNDFFQTCFNKRHPSLASYNNLFPTLRAHHPNYWKIAYFRFSKGFAGIPPLFAFEEASVFITSSLLSSKDKTSEELQSLNQRIDELTSSEEKLEKRRNDLMQKKGDCEVLIRGLELKLKWIPIFLESMKNPHTAENKYIPTFIETMFYEGYVKKLCREHLEAMRLSKTSKSL